MFFISLHQFLANRFLFSTFLGKCLHLTYQCFIFRCVFLLYLLHVLFGFILSDSHEVSLVFGFEFVFFKASIDYFKIRNSSLSINQLLFHHSARVATHGPHREAQTALTDAVEELEFGAGGAFLVLPARAGGLG